MVNYIYEIDAKLYFVPTDEVNSKGNVVTRLVVVRKMLLTPIVPGRYPDVKIVRYTRNRIPWYSRTVKQFPKPELWPTLKLAPDPQPRWKRDGSMSELECLDWLTLNVGQNAVCALHELITTKPVKVYYENEQ